MATPDEIIGHDPRGGARAAIEADQHLEAAIRSGLSAVEGLNNAVEIGRKHAWPLVVIAVFMIGFVVKSTMFYAEYSQNQLDAKAFRDATTAHLNALDKSQQEKDAADRTLFTNQQIAINRLTDIIDILRERKGS